MPKMKMGFDSYLGGDSPAMTVRALLLSVCLLASLTPVNLAGAPISRGFGIAGHMTVTENTIDWANVNSPLTVLQALIGGDSTGWFSSLDGTTMSIAGLNRSMEPVGSDFGPGAFIDFDADPTMATLGIDSIVNGMYSASGCSASLPAETTVDPLAALRRMPEPRVNPSGSPFSFAGNPGTAGAPPIQTSATCVLAGATNAGGIRLGNFSASLDEPFQTVVSDFPASGSLTGTFFAAIIVTAKVDPDGRYMLGSGLGLILLSLGSRRLLKRQAK